MSVQNYGQFVSYLWGGPERDAQRREIHPTDGISVCSQPSLKYVGHWNPKTKTIDDTVQVEGVDTVTRGRALAHWTDLRISSLVFGTTQCFASIYAFGAARRQWALLSQLVKPSPNRLSLGLSCLLGVCTLGLAVLASYRYLQARGQENAWADPVPGLRRERARIGREGFTRVWHLNYYGGDPKKKNLLHSQEVKDLWANYIQKLPEIVEQVSLQSIRAKKQWLTEFFETSPLRLDTMRFVHGVERPDWLLDEISRFEYLQGVFIDHSTVMSNHRARVHDEYTRDYTNINKQYYERAARGKHESVYTRQERSQETSQLLFKAESVHESTMQSVEELERDLVDGYLDGILKLATDVAKALSKQQPSIGGLFDSAAFQLDSTACSSK